MEKNIKPNTIVCVDEDNEFVPCVYCLKNTDRTVKYIKKLGATQFACNNCGKVAVYRIGPFGGVQGKRVKVEPIELENWEDFINEEDFLD